MNPVAAANTISGERSSATVTFPLTGDSELDAVSGILWVLEETKLFAAAKVRVLEYLAKRFQAQVERQRSDAEYQYSLQKFMGATLTPMPAAPTPPPWMITTSGGTTFDAASQMQNQQPTFPPTSAP